MATLFAATVPLIFIAEIASSSGDFRSLLVRAIGPLGLMVWALYVVRRRSASSLPMVVATMVWVGALVVLELAYSIELTVFNFSTAFGLMMLLAVLAGTLTQRHRLLWAGFNSSAVAGWIIVSGLLAGETGASLAARAVVAVAGVVFTTAFVAELYDQLVTTIKAHEQSNRLHDAIARCSEALLVHPDEAALDEAVAAILDATDADYAYVDVTEERDGEAVWRIVAQAVDSLRSEFGGWHSGLYANSPTVYRLLLDGKTAIVHTSDLSGDERELYEKDGIKSEVCVPIQIGGEMRGSIGFVEYTDDRVWSDAEIKTLWRAADMVGAYWKRHDDAAALRASNASKDKLLSSVSHEIRTPLTAIVGLSEEIVNSKGSLGDEMLYELCDIIATQSRELSELVEDLLVASRADFGNLSIRPEHIDLEEQVDRVLAGVRDTRPTPKRIELSSEGPLAYADPLRVRQVIRNLVTNAVKYGGENIEIGVYEEGEWVVARVSDDGPGISADEAELIFERYYRSSESPTLPGSVGIGLAVSRQLAEMMGGSLAYVCADGVPGFELRLPPSPQTAGTGAGDAASTGSGDPVEFVTSP